MNEIPLTGWHALIPVLAPLITTLIKHFTPKMPKIVVPFIPVVLGTLADIIMTQAGVSEGHGIMGAILGAAGVMLREVVNQFGKAVEANKQGQDLPKVSDPNV